MAVNTQIRFEKAMSASIEGYSPKATRALELAGKITLFIAGATFFGMIFASNFVKLPKWATFGIGIPAPLVLAIFGSKLTGKARERQEKQYAREDALDMTTITPAGESRLGEDFRFRTRKLQTEHGQQPPPSTQTLRLVADNYGLDVPIVTAAQILHRLDNPLHLGAEVHSNKNKNLNPKRFKKYQDGYDKLRNGVAGPLFAEIGCKGIGIRIKPEKRSFLEENLPPEVQQLLKGWRELCCYWNLYSDKPFQPAKTLFEQLFTDDCWALPIIFAEPHTYDDWSQDFISALKQMEVELKNRDFADYVRRRKERLTVAYKELESAWERSPLYNPESDVFTFFNAKKSSFGEIKTKPEACALEQTIDQVLKWKRELSPRSNVDPSETATLVDKQWQTRIANMRKLLKAGEVKAKRGQLDRLFSLISNLPEESIRSMRYRSVLRDLDPARYALLKDKKDALPFRLALESLDLENIDFELLDRQMSEPAPGMKAYAKAIGHPEFEKLTSMRLPFVILQRMLDDIEKAFEEGDSDAPKRLNRFQERELAATNRHLLFGGKTRTQLAFEHTLLRRAVETESLSEDSPAVARQKRVERHHYKRVFDYDRKTHKIQLLGFGSGLQLLTAALMIAAIFVKHRYASMALSSSGLLVVAVSLYGQSHIDGMLKKKREMLMEEHLYKRGVRSLQGKEARRVKQDCDRLGIDGESAIAHAIIYREERKGLSVGDRVRGRIIQSTADKEAARIAKGHAKHRKKGEKPVLETITIALAKNNRELAKHLVPYAEDRKRARNLVKIHDARLQVRLNVVELLPPFMQQIENDGNRIYTLIERNSREE